MVVEPKMFISYAHKSERARHFIDKLTLILDSKNEGHEQNHTRPKDRFIKTWFDENILPGESWGSKIDDAIDESFAVLVCVTAESLSSHYVTYEWSRAIGLGKLVVPVVLEQTDAAPIPVTYHPKLQEKQWAFLADVSTHRDKIVKLIEYLENKYDEYDGADRQRSIQRLIQLIYSKLNEARQIRQQSDLDNALQTLNTVKKSIEVFEQNYGDITDENAPELNDALDDVYYELGYTCYLLSSQDNGNQSCNITPSEYYKKAIKANPNHALSYVGLGMIERNLADETSQDAQPEFKATHLHNALENFTRAVKIQKTLMDPNGQSVKGSLGGIFKRLGRFPEAITQYQEAAQVKQSAYPYINIAILNALPTVDNRDEIDRNLRLALWFAQSQLRIKPDDPWAHSDELFAHIMLSSIEDSTKFIEINMEMIERTLFFSPQISLERLKEMTDDIGAYLEKYKEVEKIKVFQHLKEQITKN